jgi:hypothetical protein
MSFSAAASAMPQANEKLGPASAAEGFFSTVTSVMARNLSFLAETTQLRQC